ncbi:YaaC family protein [Actinoplanes sp. NPDC051346]|uniref:YaaC family protein n=1 Tax=Actinoplanes sp. NPDC051346 TaxID=3155048 RepID=UPI003445B661
MEDVKATLRELRSLRFDPPGHAKKGARRTTFQAALEQCEQFLAAAGDAGYATRPVQLFYALSQACRAVVAASPRIGNQQWNVHGHGLRARTSSTSVADTTVAASESGLFQSVATALQVEALAPDDVVSLRELWPLLPEMAGVALPGNFSTPALLFMPSNWPNPGPFSQAELHWIPTQVRERYGHDRTRVGDFLKQYPALHNCEITRHGITAERVKWIEHPLGLSLDVEWRSNDSPVRVFESQSTRNLGLVPYCGPDDWYVTPPLGQMRQGLHPFLALWATLLALSSLARYEPAPWSRMIDIDRSAEANALEHLLDKAAESISRSVLNVLTLSTAEGRPSVAAGGSPSDDEHPRG